MEGIASLSLSLQQQQQIVVARMTEVQMLRNQDSV